MGTQRRAMPLHGLIPRCIFIGVSLLFFGGMLHLSPAPCHGCMAPWIGAVCRGRNLGAHVQHREHGLSHIARHDSSQRFVSDQTVASLDDQQYLEYYTSLVEQLKRQQNSHPGLELMPGASFGCQETWSVGRHYLMLTSASGKEILGWAWFEEESNWWLLQHIWVSESRRRAGLASLMLRYIESASQFAPKDSPASKELRLTAIAGANGFYDRVGFTVLSGCVYAKSMSDSRTEFQEAHCASRFCDRGMGMPMLDFRLHVLRHQ